ncbi:MAG: hypothetical protein IJG68_01250 [Bacilli bacterium]|nr:hypothetical protein [Bacilli bacterium]
MKKSVRLLLFLFFIIPVSVFAKEENDVTLYFFHGDGCPHCAEEEIFLKTLPEKYPYLTIVDYETWHNEENDDFLKKDIGKALDMEFRGVPVNIIGESVIQGYNASAGRELERAIQYYHENEYEDIVEEIKNGTYVKKEKEKESFEEKEKELDKELSVDIPIFGPVNLKKFSLGAASALIGLIDGFNPCAMWVLLFLISSLIGMKDRKRMWILGSIFLLTSALFYLLIMLSWIQIVVQFTTVVWIRNVIALVAIIGAFINLKSFFKSNETGCDVVDEKKRKKIFTKIKNFTKEKNLFLAIIGVITLAISVNIVELACSAGLPLVFSELMAINNVTMMSKFLYTFVYICFFLIDDFIVFIIAMKTMKVTGISTKYNKYSHLIGGVLMLAIGIMLLIKPEWLMFNFK